MGGSGWSITPTSLVLIVFLLFADGILLMDLCFHESNFGHGNRVPFEFELENFQNRLQRVKKPPTRTSTSRRAPVPMSWTLSSVRCHRRGNEPVVGQVFLRSLVFDGPFDAPDALGFGFRCYCNPIPFFV